MDGFLFLSGQANRLSYLKGTLVDTDLSVRNREAVDFKAGYFCEKSCTRLFADPHYYGLEGCVSCGSSLDSTDINLRRGLFVLQDLGGFLAGADRGSGRL